jgi:uncharacterized protein
MQKLKLPLATFVNMIAVIAGSSVGLLLQAGISENIQQILFQSLGLGTVLIAIKMMLKLPDGYLLAVIFSLISGGVLGELLSLDVWFSGLSSSLAGMLQVSEGGFSQGLITAFLLFCVGSMTIVGALEEGLENKRELLYVKSTMDGISSVALASTFGIGVLFSIIPMLIFQGGLTVFSSWMKRWFDEKTIDAVSAVGGVLIFGIAIRLLELGDIKLENLLPALFLIVIFSKITQISSKK